MGTQILEHTRDELTRSLSTEDIKKVRFIKWNELIDGVYKEKLEYLFDLYKNSKSFSNSIHSIVRNTVSKETRIFSDDDINRLGEYIVSELPELINKTRMDGILCDAYTYPFGGELISFVDRIQKGEIHPEIKKNIMDTEPKVFLEVR